jgi:hypothetical protein
LLVRWRTRGVDIVLASDGTSIVRFTGRSFKLEIGACKIIAPHIAGAQQAGYMGKVLFVHSGEECYDSLKATLGRMIREKHLTNSVSITVDGKLVKLNEHPVLEKAQPSVPIYRDRHSVVMPCTLGDRVWPLGYGFVPYVACWNTYK